jgi:hypothetical protein
VRAILPWKEFSAIWRKCWESYHPLCLPLPKRHAPKLSKTPYQQVIRLSAVMLGSRISERPCSARTALHPRRWRFYALPLRISTSIGLRQVAHIRQSRSLHGRRRLICSAVRSSTRHADPPCRINRRVGEVCTVWSRSRSATIVALLLRWHGRRVCQRSAQRLAHDRRGFAWVHALRSSDGGTFGVWVESSWCVCGCLAFRDLVQEACAPACYEAC